MGETKLSELSRISEKAIFGGNQMWRPVGKAVGEKNED